MPFTENISENYLLTGDYIMTTPDGDCIENGSVVVSGDKIIDLGKRAEMTENYPTFSEFKEKDSIIFPGLINAHTHIAMTLFRGIAEDLPLEKWLNESIFPREKTLSEDMVYYGSLLGCSEMIRSGTTAFCDMYIFEESVARACEISGLRSLLGEGLFDFPSPSYGVLEDGIMKTAELIEKYMLSEKIRFSASPHSVYTCSIENVKRIKDLARKKKSKFQIHAAETREENENSIKNNGLSVVQLLDREGILDRDTLLFHCVWINEKDADIIAGTGATPVICSTSNLKLGSGIPPLPMLLDRSIHFCLGTDGPASNNSLDMIGEMKISALIQKGVNMNPEICPAEAVFRASTLNGAEALGFDKSGIVAPSMKADLIVLDINESNSLPLYSPLHHILYSASSKDVRDCIVGGKFLMKNKKVISVDLETVKKEISKIKDFFSKKYSLALAK
ncbi:amidohydrolase [candidate division WOR-3 bacterium]|nr:amidohydrolase [candidate division WOR-3 bacterium]